MSCLLTSPETISNISNFAEKLLNIGYDFFGFCANEELYIELLDCQTSGHFDACKIYARLCEMNQQAYQGRYNEAETIQYPPCDLSATITKRMVINDQYHTAAVQQWHFEMLKHLDFYIYQCSENTTSRSDLFKAITGLRAELANFILMHSVEYLKENWN